MKALTCEKVALIGTGVIGRGWLRVFADAGCEVKIYDQSKDSVAKALSWMEKSASQDIKDGFISPEKGKEILRLVQGCDQLGQALAGAQYVQESCPERLYIKQGIFAELDEKAEPDAVLASSTSGLDINDITEGLTGVSRCIMAHPFNPAYVLPVVEVLPARQTAPKVLDQTVAFLTEVGSVPVVLKRYASGFIGNRLQAAVVREAIHLVESGVADVGAVDALMRHGLGPRWGIMGSFEVNHTNADGGIGEYYQNFGDAYTSWMLDLDSSPPIFSSEMVDRFSKEVSAMVGQASVEEIRQWRDRLMRKMRLLKQQDPHP